MKKKAKKKAFKCEMCGLTFVSAGGLAAHYLDHRDHVVKPGETFTREMVVEIDPPVPVNFCPCCGCDIKAVEKAIRL